MKTINFKLEDNFLKEIKSKLKKHRYTTISEFIREAIRDKLSNFSKKDDKEKLK